MSIRSMAILVFGLVAAFMGAATVTAPPAQAQAYIVPCGANPNWAMRKTNTSEGIACRRNNIDAVLAGLRWSRRVDSAALQRCLGAVRAELLGTYGSPRGAGPRYYAKLSTCKAVAGRSSSFANLDSALSSDPNTPQEQTQDQAPDQTADGDCDDDCAADIIRQFAEDIPEPEEE